MKAVLIFNYNYSCTTGVYAKKALEKFDVETKILLPQEKEKIYDIKPDFVLAVDFGTHYILDVNYHPKALWLIDTHLSLICDETMAKSFDVIFVAQKEDYERLKKKFKYVYWLPLAGDLDYHGKKSLAKIYDIGFVGGFGSGRRKKFLLNLKKLYPNSFIGQTDCKDIGKIYSQSKIVFNYSIKNDLNMRIFEALISGSLLITNKIKNNGFDELFQVGKELIIFENFDDLIKKINYFLENEREREEIAYNGYQKALNFHTYDHRVKFILEKISKIERANFKDRNYTFLKIELKIKEILWIFIKILRRIKWKIQELA